MNLGIIDVETTELKHGEWPKTKFWGFYDGQDYRRFESTKLLCRFLRSQKPMRLFHHYNFDVLQLLLDGAPAKIVKTHNSRIIATQLGKHRLVNSFSLYPVSLGKILAAFEIKKISLDKLEERNYSDCVDGLNCIVKLSAEIESVCGVNPLTKETIGGVGAAAAKLVAGSMPIDLRFIESFRGGRVEVYDTRKQMATLFDVNSSYPFSICQAQEKMTLLKVRVKTNDWFCPFFDSRNFERLEFPNGDFNSWIFADTLERYIIPNSKHTKIHIIKRVNIDGAWLVRLQDYTRSLFELKQRHAGTGRGEACKFLLNSTYGRIGLRPEREICIVTDRVAAGRNVLWTELPNGMFISFFKIKTEPKSNFPLAAFITDNARGRLYEAFVKTKAIYGDTDSVFSPLEKAKGLYVGTGLGDWKNKGCATFQAHSPKDYTFGSKTVLKGGKQSFQWTLKRLVAGKPVALVERTRRTSLEKRRLLADGTTEPNIVRY
jgi:hypothetical protein